MVDFNAMLFVPFFFLLKMSFSSTVDTFCFHHNAALISSEFNSNTSNAVLPKTEYPCIHLGAASKLNRQRLRAVSFVRPRLIAGGRPAVEFWSGPLCRLYYTSVRLRWHINQHTYSVVGGQDQCTLSSLIIIFSSERTVITIVCSA